MILELENNCGLTEAKNIQQQLGFMQLDSEIKTDDVNGPLQIIILRGVDENIRPELFSHLPGVARVREFSNGFKLAGKSRLPNKSTVIDLGEVKIGDGSCVVMAGPCSIENEHQFHQIAAKVSQAGANILRGGAFKPRTSPYDFQGLGEPGLRFMHDAARANNLLSISEVMAVEDVDLVTRYVDILQIGARNMQNYNLLRAVGQSGKPVMLKRGMCATYKEFILAAEYILSQGNPNVMLCERGIRTFETYCRNTLDLTAVPVLKQLTHLPVIVDPSHGTGLRELVPPMAKAAAAVGADGIMVEVHTDPDKSMSDARQTICPETFTEMMQSLQMIRNAVGKAA